MLNGTRSLGALAALVAVCVACSGAGAQERIHVSYGTLPTATSTSTVNAHVGLSPSPAEQAQRNHPSPAPRFPDMSGVIDPKLVLHHSGGPYLTAQQVAGILLNNFQCKLGHPRPHNPASVCVQVDVRFFGRYADFWAVEGGQTQFIGSWGPDREMYLATIFGKLPVITTVEAQNGPIYAPSRTFQIDATTGEVLMTGGPPLPEGFQGVKSFRASPFTTEP